MGLLHQASSCWQLVCPVLSYKLPVFPCQWQTQLAAREQGKCGLTERPSLRLQLDERVKKAVARRSQVICNHSASDKHHSSTASDDVSNASETASGPTRRQCLAAVITAGALTAEPPLAEVSAKQPAPSAAPLTAAAEVESSRIAVSSGYGVLRDPRQFQGLAMQEAARKSKGLTGLLPAKVEPMEMEVERALEALDRLPDSLAKYQYLIGLQGASEDIFYALIVRHLPDMLPLIYTPTVGEGCLNFGRLLPRPLGLYVSLADNSPERMDELLSHWPEEDAKIAVITDGERILGLGDLGAHGMGIPVGKCMVYTACGGVNPRHLLPITVDVGTENKDLLEDPFYLGDRRRRVRGPEYEALMDTLVAALLRRYGSSFLVHWEDLSASNSWRLLERCKRAGVCTFNDDIQSTAAVVLAGILAALRITGGQLQDQRFLFFGAGQANLGTAQQIVYALLSEGIPLQEAREKCWLVDSQGLVYSGRERVGPLKADFAHPLSRLARLGDATSLEDCIRAVRPTMLIGAAGIPQAFTEEVIREMMKVCQQPVVFALSNPARKAECTAWEALHWSQGRAIFASGSPFPPVQLSDRVVTTGFANNAFIFPGIGLGASVSGAASITDVMFYAAAKALAGLVKKEELMRGSIYPDLERMRECALGIASQVGALGEPVLAGRSKSQKERTSWWRAHIMQSMYWPTGCNREADL